ncbi:MBL fold metallo-hydrolase [Ramlibacter sp. MAHUQ-53]|uniref:MBL fold metallo-hydrolase n=1 Tax=unclassified Ramlibacter TaxID=2617605 RepID=UPI00363AFAEB
MTPEIESFFDPATCTWTHVVHAGQGTACAVIDPVLDYDAKAGRTATRSAQRVVDFVQARGLRVEWILETHAHADHLSAAAWLRGQLGGRIGIGALIPQVQRVFKALFHLESDFAADGSQFDHLFEDGETFAIGALQARVLAVPGHTPACVAFEVGDAVFAGDTLFPPDVGTARCDFPGGSAQQLYRSVRRLLAMPGTTRLFMCHDYPPEGRAPRCETTVAEQRAGNIHIRDGVDEADFVAMRTKRDAGLDKPLLIIPAIQVNIRAGRLPEPEANGVSYLKIPLNAL